MKGWVYRSVVSGVEASLQRLGTDHLDFFPAVSLPSVCQGLTSVAQDPVE